MRQLVNLDDSQIHFSIYAHYIKRPLDFIVSLVVVIILSPIFAILCILIKIKLGSPILVP